MRVFENKIKYKIFKIGMLLLVLGMIVIACGIRDNSSYAVQPGNNATENNEQEKIIKMEMQKYKYILWILIL